MTTKLIEMQARISSVLRRAASDLNMVDDRVLDQKVSMCIHDDMSTLDISNRSVQIFIEFITLVGMERLTVRDIRNSAEATLSKRPHARIAEAWTWIDIDAESREILQSSFQCGDTKHLNQLLKYIGGKSIEESYRIAVNELPNYSKASEYDMVSYSLGINYTHFANGGENESGAYLCQHYDSNAFRLLRDSRLYMEKELIDLVQYGDDPDDNEWVEIHYISMYMNGIEVLQFPIGSTADDFYREDIDLNSLLPTAKVMINGDNFIDMLFSGELLKNKDYRWLNNRLKGRHLEEELGM